MNRNRLHIPGVPGFEEPEDPRHYQAYSTHKGSDRQLYIDVRDKKGDGQLVAYSYIVRIRYTADRLVSLTGTDFSVLLEGKNLGKLVGLLHDEKIRYVQEFNDNRFDPPADDEPFIGKITMQEK